MELCIKTYFNFIFYFFIVSVSILVLMELCIKTWKDRHRATMGWCFNPCFNGTMYKNRLDALEELETL